MIGRGAILAFVLGAVAASQAPRPGGPEFTDSLLPISLQVLSHYSDQLREGPNSNGKARKQITELATALVNEAKRQGVAKYQGVSDSVLEQMRPTTSYTAKDQLRFVLQTLLDRGEAKRQDTLVLSKKALGDLDVEDSDLSEGMKGLSALAYS